MKKFIRLLGFALFLVLTAFVGLIAYQENFDFTQIMGYFNALAISVLAPLLSIHQITLPLIMTLTLTIIALGLAIYLMVSLISRLRIISGLLSFIGLMTTYSFILLIVNGYFPDATTLQNLGNITNFVDLLMIPISNPNPGLRASAFSGLIVSIVFFTLIFVILNIVDLLRNPFKKQSSKVLPLVKEETVIAQELSKFVMPSQIRLPQVEVAVPQNTSTGTNGNQVNGAPSILEPTPIVVLPQTPVLPEKQDVVNARQMVLQIKEKIRAQIRLQLLEAKQSVSKVESTQNFSPIEPTPQPLLPSESLKSEPKVSDTNPEGWSASQIQEKVNEAIAAEIAQLEPKTKDQVNTLINEELIKYDSLNREVMESLVSEKIEQVVATSFDQFKQEMQTLVTKSIEDMQLMQKQSEQNSNSTTPISMDIDEKVKKMINQSPLAKKVDELDLAIKQANENQTNQSNPSIKLSDVETLIEQKTNSFLPLLEKLQPLEQQVQNLSQSLANLSSIPFVKQEIFEQQSEQFIQLQQRLIQLQQELSTAKGVLDQFQIETLSRSNHLQEKLSLLEINQPQKSIAPQVMDENNLVSLLKKHQQVLQPELPMQTMQSLISNEVKKQVGLTPNITKEEVKKLIEEAIKAIPPTKVASAEIDEKTLANKIQATLPSFLSEADVINIVKSTISPQTKLDEALVLGLITNEIKKQMFQNSSLTKEDVKTMIEEAMANVPVPIADKPQPVMIQQDLSLSQNPSVAVETLVPVIKKKNARAPENDKRAEQFKSVITPDLGVTRTGKKKIIRIPFQQRMASAEPMILAHYDELKNYLLSYQVKSRISNTGDMFRLHKEEFVKITIAGKSLKLYLALNPEDYKDSPIPVDDASDKKIYKQIPLVFKVKSDLSLKRAKKLIDDLMAKKSLPQKEIPFLPWSKAFIK